MPIVRSEVDDDGDIIYWIDTGREYVPVKDQIYYAWHAEYLRTRTEGYTHGEILNAHLTQGDRLWKRQTRILGSILKDKIKHGR